uniref:Retrotransposon protein n=2 Tax=Cucumis melo TaxID=3656 RepID=A0A9I9CKE1_CUCME
MFGKDYTIKAHAEMFRDIGCNMLGPNDGVPAEDGLEMELMAMYSLRMNMSSNDMMASRFGQSNYARSSSNGQKRKRDMQPFETYDLNRDAMDAANDQIRIIAKWPDRAIHREDAMVREVITHIEFIPGLSMEDISKCVMIVTEKVLLMRSFIKMPDSM